MVGMPPPRLPFPAFFAVAAALVTAPAASEEAGAPRAIDTPPLKLIGDGTAPSASPPRIETAIATPPLRLIGDGAAAPQRTPPQAVTIETRPLKLIGAKP